MPGGSVQKVGNGVVYYPGITQITDPSVANITTLGNLRALSGLKAIANANGTPILVNALPGQLGGLALGTGTAPSTWRLDMNLLKRIKINERFTAQVGRRRRTSATRRSFRRRIRRSGTRASGGSRRRPARIGLLCCRRG